MARPNTTSPDLVSDLREIKSRLDALERKPIPQSIYDQYPSIEWSAIGRGRVAGNVWSSCGVANVTGLKYDRVEVKYITDRIITGRSEAEVRLAAFRHDHANQFKECIAATRTVRLTGSTNRVLGVGKWRWIHGIQFGWDYTDADDAVYTIELQHRNPDDCPQTADPNYEVFNYYKRTNQNEDPDLGVWSPINIVNDQSNSYRMIAERRPQGSSFNAPAGWIEIPGAWDGSYNMSNMHYCVGLTQERLPEATVPGWQWFVGGGAVHARDANINEPYLNT